MLAKKTGQAAVEAGTKDGDLGATIRWTLGRNKAFQLWYVRTDIAIGQRVPKRGRSRRKKWIERCCYLLVLRCCQDIWLFFTWRWQARVEN